MPRRLAAARAMVGHGPGDCRGGWRRRWMQPSPHPVALVRRYTRPTPAPRETHYYSKKRLSGQTLARWPLAVPGLDPAPETVDNRAFRRLRGRLQSPAPTKKISTMTLDLWQRGCERLASRAARTPVQYLDPPAGPRGAVASDDAGGAVPCSAVRVPNRFKLDWIRAQYAGLIESVSASWPPSRCGWS